MALLKRTAQIDEKKFFLALLFGFITIQIVSWILSEYTDFPILKGGPILLFFLVVVAIVSLFVLGRKLGDLDLKKDGIFILFVFVFLILLFIFIPKMVPEIFSVGGAEIREFLRGTIGTVMKVGSGVV